MITIHRQIKKLSDKQVLKLIEKFGGFASNINLNFGELPRFTIDLSGAPLNIDVLKFILHSAASSNTLLQPEISRFFFMNKKELFSLEGATQGEIEKVDWVYFSNQILHKINNCLTITYEGGIWDLYPSRELAQIQEIRELKKIILQKQVERLNGGVFIGNTITNTKGSVHIGNIVNNETSVQKDSIESSKEKIEVDLDLDLIITLITQGKTGDAIIFLLEYSKLFDRDIINTTILISSRYHKFKIEHTTGVLSIREKVTESTLIDRAILDIVYSMEKNKKGKQ